VLGASAVVLGAWLVAPPVPETAPSVLESAPDDVGDTARATSIAVVAPIRASDAPFEADERSAVEPHALDVTVRADVAIDELAAALRRGRARHPAWTSASTQWAAALSDASWAVVERVASERSAHRDRRLAALELLRQRTPRPTPASTWLEPLRDAWSSRADDACGAFGAVRALGALGSTSDRLALVDTLASDPDATLRLAARRGLEAGPARETARLVAERIERTSAEREALLTTLASVAFACSDLDPNAREPLARAVRGAWLDDATARERRAAVIALHAVSPEAASSWLEDLLRPVPPVPEDRERAGRLELARHLVAAGPLPADDVAALLAGDALDDESELLLAEAAVGADRPPLDRPRVASVLGEALASAIPARRRRALNGFARLGGPAAYAAIGRTLRTADEPWLIRSALQAGSRLEARAELVELVERWAASDVDSLRRHARHVLDDWRRAGS